MYVPHTFCRRQQQREKFSTIQAMHDFDATQLGLGSCI